MANTNTAKLAEMGSDELAKRKAAIDAQIAALLEQQTEMALFVAEQQEAARKAAIDNFVDGSKAAILAALPADAAAVLESVGGSIILSIRLGNEMQPATADSEEIPAEDPIVIERGAVTKRTRIASSGSGAADGTKERRDLKGFREYLAKSDPSRWASFTADYKVRLAKRLRDNPGTTELSSKNSIENFLSLKYLELVPPHVKSMYVKIVAADAPDDVAGDDTATDTGDAEQPEGSNAEGMAATA